VNMGPQIDINDFGKSWAEPSRISDQMLNKVDEEIKSLVNTALERAITILKDNRKKLDEVAKVLMEKETIVEEEFEGLMK